MLDYTMHFCQDELMALMLALPGVGYVCNCIKCWLKKRSQRKTQ